jgi:ABC-2 type transport system permease protein
MLWNKSWMETRWRFLIGLALLTILACGTVFDYPTVVKLMPLARSLETTIDASGPLGRLIKEGTELQHDYRGFVWWQWFRQNLTQMWTLFAVLLGSGGLLSPSAGSAALFTLSLPASRNRLLGVRATTGLAELLVLAFVPSLLIPLLSPAIGQSYSVGDVLVHGACLFIAGTVFFSLAFLLSTVFGDLWRPLLITCALAVVLAVFGQAGTDRRYSIFWVMSAEAYFRRSDVPWLGLLTTAAVSATMLYAATRNFARQDF